MARPKTIAEGGNAVPRKTIAEGDRQNNQQLAVDRYQKALFPVIYWVYSPATRTWFDFKDIKDAVVKVEGLKKAGDKGAYITGRSRDVGAAD